MPEKKAVNELLTFLCWSPDTVKKGLQYFLDKINVDEIMVVSHIFDHIARLRSFEILHTF